MEGKIICPVCKEQGIKSQVRTTNVMTTLMWYGTFYDEDGGMHSHDDNSRTTIGHCTNGHKFHYRYENNCWCGWKGKTEEYRIINEEV